MAKYIVTKSTTAEYLVEDAEDANAAKQAVIDEKGKCTGYRELFDVTDASQRRPAGPSVSPPRGSGRPTQSIPPGPKPIG